jgi:DNA-binding response OmpR family regulator
VIGKIKSDARTCHIPVILLTAKSAPIHQINGLQQGADAYITKPFSNHILQLNIHNMLALKASFCRIMQHLAYLLNTALIAEPNSKAISLCAYVPPYLPDLT